MSLRTVYYRLPPEIRVLARRLYFLPTDIINGFTGKRHKYEPPRGKIFVGHGDFIEQGQKQLDLLIHYTGLQPHHHVLDIGCGIGRTAVALTKYLDGDARYEGFDVVQEGIRWCQRKVTPDFPNFHFKHFKLSNDLYNIYQADAADFKFPYDNEQFDVIFLFSVFTHMLPVEVEHYLSEIYRVLRPGGRCLATLFTYDDSYTQTIADDKGDFQFPHNMGGYRLMDRRVKSANVAYEAENFALIIRRSGLFVFNVIDGTWKDLIAESKYFQDIFLLEKPISINA